MESSPRFVFYKDLMKKKQKQEEKEQKWLRQEKRNVVTILNNVATKFKEISRRNVTTI